MRVPLYFGASGRPLFGWYHEAEADRLRDEGVVICQPLGHEYLNAHRAMRHLANRLAGEGLPVLRFDYDGVGDSAGLDEDPERLGAWLESVRYAIEALRRQSGCARISLAGLRLGATLAAIASCETDVHGLVLWAPCIRGRTYVRELKALALAGVVADDSHGATRIEAGGFMMTGETERAIAAINLEEIVPRARRVLIVGRDDFAQDPRLAMKWSASGVAVELRAAPGYVDMLATPHNTKVPSQALDLVVNWLAAGTKAVARKPTADTIPAVPRVPPSSAAIDDVQESAVRFGDRGDIFGVFSQPRQDGRPGAPVIILSNAGATHHVGPGRLYVHLARALARAGLPSLRLDLPGLGDSILEDATREGVTYPETASRVIAAAIDMLGRDGRATAFVVLGLCSGAHTAFHAALDLEDRPIVETVLINPLTFYYAPGMPLDVPSTGPADRSWQRTVGTFRGLGHRWKLLHAATDAAKLAMHAGRRLWRAPARTTRRGELPRDLARLAARSRRVTFVFSQFDPGYDILMTDAGREVRRAIKQGQATLLTIKHANHTFDAMGPRATMLDSLTADLAGRYARQAARPATPQAHVPVTCRDRQATDRIRLLTFVTDFGCGGTERQVVNLGLALDANRFALEYGCSWPSGQLLPELAGRGIPLSDYPIRSLYGAGAVHQRLRLARHFVRSRTQILHAYNFYCNVFAVPAARLAGVPIVIASIRDRGVYLTAAQRHAQRYVCRMADCVLVNAESIKEWLVADGYDPSRIVVIRNGIDLPRFDGSRASDVRTELGIPSDAPIVAMVARLNPQKGVEDFIDAAAIVSREHPGARFLIVGEGHVANHGAPLTDAVYRQALETRVRRAALEGRVILTGYRADVPAILAETSVSVLPSHSEGLSNTLLESMAAGVPVVATRVGGTPEAIEDGKTGLLVPSKAPDLLAAAIARVLSDVDLARRLAAAGRQSVHDRFGVDRMVRATEELYLDLLARRAAEPGWRGRLRLTRPALGAFAAKRF